LGLFFPLPKCREATVMMMHCAEVQGDKTSQLHTITNIFILEYVEKVNNKIKTNYSPFSMQFFKSLVFITVHYMGFFPSLFFILLLNG